METERETGRDGREKRKEVKRRREKRVRGEEEEEENGKGEEVGGEGRGRTPKLMSKCLRLYVVVEASPMKV